MSDESDESGRWLRPGGEIKVPGALFGIIWPLIQCFFVPRKRSVHMCSPKKSYPCLRCFPKASSEVGLGRRLDDNLSISHVDRLDMIRSPEENA